MLLQLYYSCPCKITHPDLLHLSLRLSPPPSRCRPSSPLSPVYLYLCSLFVCCQFILFVSSCLFPASLFLALLVFDTCLACPDPEPACLTTLPAVLYLCPYMDFRPLPDLTLPSCTFASVAVINIVTLTWSASGSYLILID